MFNNLFNKKNLLMLVLALALGFATGAGYCWTQKSDKPYNAAQLTQNIYFDKVQAGRLQCIVLRDKAELYNIPSALQGKVIDHLSKNVQVDFVDAVSSQDKDEREALTTQQLQFRRWLFEKHVIPAGTQVTVLREDDGSGETRGRVTVDGKSFELDFATEFLRFAYVGQWKKVEFNGKPGFVKFNDVSAEKLM